MRRATACLQCRSVKRKCVTGKQAGRSQTVACSRCQILQLPCSFIPTKSLPSAFNPSPPSVDVLASEPPLSDDCNDQLDTHTERLNSSSSVGSEYLVVGQLLGDSEWQDRVVGYYFDLVHDKHHSLFHRSTFESDLHAQQVPSIILYAVVALGFRFASLDEQGCRSEDSLKAQSFLTDKAHEELDIRDISLTTVQACILLGTLCYVDGKSEAEALYYATAIRLAVILDLPRRNSSTELERQVNLRVWWTLYMIDVWSSAGLQIGRQLSFDQGVDLPANEACFASMSTDMSLHIPSTTETGIWGEMARLSRIWSEIQDLNKASVENNLSPTSLAPQIARLADSLRTWRNTLPPELTETPENLERCQTLGFGASLAALHLGFHYYQEVLYYQYMAESHQNPSVLAESYASECATHARAFCDLLYLCERIPGCKCMYAMVGHMLVITSTVYVHMLLFRDESEQAGPIRQRLEHNFEILTELQKYWPTLDTSLGRLKVFHNACLYSTQSFRMDRWMLSFIMQHGTFMPEKFFAVDDVPVGLWAESAAETGQDGNSLQDWYSQTLL